MNEDLEKAIRLYVGWKIAPYPQYSEDRVVKEFGCEGRFFIKTIISILHDLKGIDPNWDKHDLIDASKFAASEIGKKYDLSDDSVKALHWVYSWGYK